MAIRKAVHAQLLLAWRVSVSKRYFARLDVEVPNLQFADTDSQVVDELYILAQVVTQMGIILVGGQLVQIEQALLYHPRHVQGAFHGFQAALPLVVVGPPDTSQVDLPPWLVLQPHPSLGLLPFLP